MRGWRSAIYERAFGKADATLEIAASTVALSALSWGFELHRVRPRVARLIIQCRSSQKAEGGNRQNNGCTDFISVSAEAAI